MQKKKAGFSYVEMLAAAALFMIVLLGVLPLTLGARQNTAFARENLQLYLAADSLSLAVRDLILGGAAITDERIRGLAQGFGVINYCVYIFGPGGEARHGSPFHSSSGGCGASLTGFEGITRGREGLLVYVVTRNDYFARAGRAISVVIDFEQSSGIWRNAGG